ncbi:MAG: chemotaxis protein CheA, partial [Nitrospirae bacterium]|nr:chemotaxis protein CheA [Nitrospirota bacterium]
MAFDTKKFILRFAQEANDHIQKLNNGLLTLEKNPNDSETINEIFRSAHTIKGASKMLKLTAITDVAHRMEDILDELRGQKITFSKEMSNLLFAGVDAISDMINVLAGGGEISSIDPVPIKDLCDKLEIFIKDEEVSAGSQADTGAGAKTITPIIETPINEISPKTKEEKNIPEIKEKPQSENLPKSHLQTQISEQNQVIKVNAKKLDELIKLIGEILSSHIKIKERYSDFKKLEKISSQYSVKGSNPSNEGIGLMPISLEERIKETYKRINSRRKSRQPIDCESGSCETMINSKTISKNIVLLEQGITSNLLKFKDDLTLYDLLIDDLRERAINLRMLPLSTVFEQFPRLIRDIARSSGKEVELQIEGGSTELDKKIIEKIEDSFIHLLRNSVDHGIETPAQRINAGKPKAGTIKLCAYYEGGSVLIELSDDGAGIALGKIKEKALSKKLFDQETLNKMTPSEIINIIFYPGFSTSPIITDISGRGVGMDVVKKSITEDLKGTIEIKSVEGQGSIFYIRLPLTLAITRVLLISVDDTTFAIPSYYCQELLRVSQKEIIPVANRSAIRLREQFIPVTHLSLILFKKEQNKTLAPNNNILILIIKAGNERMGLIIDAIIDEQDMTILPLP